MICGAGPVCGAHGDDVVVMDRPLLRKNSRYVVSVDALSASVVSTAVTLAAEVTAPNADFVSTAAIAGTSSASNVALNSVMGVPIGSIGTPEATTAPVRAAAVAANPVAVSGAAISMVEAMV
ncbi:hypothetical protein AWC21_01615 [Mycolicibacterium peregrinum]|nr:hypothetical protein AWC21_01615 [Mycolicibacterium peregrinum]